MKTTKAGEKKKSEEKEKKSITPAVKRQLNSKKVIFVFIFIQKLYNQTKEVVNAQMRNSRDSFSDIGVVEDQSIGASKGSTDDTT